MPIATPGFRDDDQRVLEAIARDFGTPFYAYFLDDILDRTIGLRAALGGAFELSYAIKSNPNTHLLAALHREIRLLDASSIGEVERALAAGYTADHVSFSGPGKRRFELERAVRLGCRDIVCESEQELNTLTQIATVLGKRVSVLARINPLRAPAGFGVHMGGRPSQFGIDDEQAIEILTRVRQHDVLDLEGFHIYTGTNCLDAGPLAENLSICVEIFERLSDALALSPRTLIVGAGFGVPYHADEAPLHIERFVEGSRPSLERIQGSSRLANARLVLELGRYLVGPSGVFVTSVVTTKVSRGTRFAVLDGGFNNHLAACGLMGTLIRRNWLLWKLGEQQDAHETCTLVGPLCTPIDQLAAKVALPRLEAGDLIAVGSSGAYGLSASPIRFISHPEPREFLVSGRGAHAAVHEITEHLVVSPFALQDVETGPGWVARRR